MTRILPISAFLMILCGVLALVFCKDAGAAEFEGDGGAVAWVQSTETHAPGPAGLIDITIGPVPGQPDSGGGYADGRIWLTGFSRTALEHELGHVFDERQLDDEEHALMLPSLGYPDGTPWVNPAQWTTDLYCKHIACPDERLADLYAGCALGYKLTKANTGRLLKRSGGRVLAWWSGYGLRLNVDEYHALCSQLWIYADLIGTPR